MRNTNFSRIGKNLTWTYYDVVDGTITWTGWDEDFWWNNIAHTQSFHTQLGSSGRRYRLNPRTGIVHVVLDKATTKITQKEITIIDGEEQRLVIKVDGFKLNVHHGLQTVNGLVTTVESTGQNLVEILGWEGIQDPHHFITEDEALRRRLNAWD